MIERERDCYLCWMIGYNETAHGNSLKVESVHAMTRESDHPPRCKLAAVASELLTCYYLRGKVCQLLSSALNIGHLGHIDHGFLNVHHHMATRLSIDLRHELGIHLSPQNDSIIMFLKSTAMLKPQAVCRPISYGLVDAITRSKMSSCGHNATSKFD